MTDIRQLTADYAVAPQISPADVPAIAAAGFKLVICNRPDMEVGAHQSTTVMRAAVEEAGLKWAENSFPGNMLTLGNVEDQREIASTSDGPVLSYCRTGTRSATVWALSQAGDMPTDEIIAAAARAGYSLEHLRQTIDQLAARRSA